MAYITKINLTAVVSICQFVFLFFSSYYIIYGVESIFLFLLNIPTDAVFFVHLTQKFILYVYLNIDIILRLDKGGT